MARFQKGHIRVATAINRGLSVVPVTPLRRDFLDDHEWRRLAKEQGYLLPQWKTRCTTGGMERWLHKLGISVEDYLAWSGEKDLKDFRRCNPTWPLRAWVGLLLERLEEKTSDG